MTTQGRRPITAEEVPHLEALGQRVTEMRTAVGLTRRSLSRLAPVSYEHLSAIERGKRRTRRSMLQRILAPIVHDDALEMELDELVAIAGPALALEIDEAYAERAQRRRERRDRRYLPAALDECRKAARSVRNAMKVLPANSPNAQKRQDLLEGMDRRVAELEARLAEPLPDRSEAVPTSTKGTAQTAYNAFMAELTRGGRRGGITLTEQQSVRLKVLRAAAEAERASAGDLG